MLRDVEATQRCKQRHPAWKDKDKGTVEGVSVLHESGGLSHNDLHDNMLLLLLVMWSRERHQVAQALALRQKVQRLRNTFSNDSSRSKISGRDKSTFMVGRLDLNPFASMPHEPKMLQEIIWHIIRLPVPWLAIEAVAQLWAWLFV